MHRLLAREGINAEQLARDLKSFELKVSFLKLMHAMIFYFKVLAVGVTR